MTKEMLPGAELRDTGLESLRKVPLQTKEAIKT